MANSPKNVCIFGLSANPPTGLLGHQGIVKKLIDVEKFDEIWILPVYRHMYSSKRSLASFEHRMEMCKLNFEKLSKFPECRVVVKPTERTVCKRRMKEDPLNKTGTADILDFLTGAYPNTKFSLALGADSYLDLANGKWTRADALAKHINNRFEVVARECSKDHVDEALEDMVDAQNAKANSMKDGSGSSDTLAFGATLHHLSRCQADVSSTQVRAQLAELELLRQGTIDEDSPLRNPMLIDPEVLGYCRSAGLYKPVDEQSDEYQSEETIRRERARSEAGFLGGWGKWFIGMLTLTVILLALLGVSYSPTTGLVIPPILGGELPSPLITIDNVEELTSGKTVFVKFMAPWCGHCRNLKPTWDALASSINKKEDDGLGHLLVADVDCTSTKGRPLCEEHGVGGFPTLKYGDLAQGDLEEYEGGRELSELKEFVLEMAAPCTPSTMDQCSIKDKEKLEKFLAYSKEELDSEIQKYELMKKDAVKAFEEGVEQLKATHRTLMETKENTLLAIRKNGLNNARAVKRSKQ